MARPSVFAADGAPVTQTLEFPTYSEIVQFPHTRFAAQRYRFDLHMPYRRHYLAQPRQDVPIDDLAMVDFEMKLAVGAPVPSLESAAKMKSLRKFLAVARVDPLNSDVETSLLCMITGL